MAAPARGAARCPSLLFPTGNGSAGPNFLHGPEWLVSGTGACVFPYVSLQCSGPVYVCVSGPLHASTVPFMYALVPCVWDICALMYPCACLYWRVQGTTQGHVYGC